MTFTWNFRHKAISLILILSTFFISGCTINDLETINPTEASNHSKVVLTLFVGQDALVTFPSTFYKPNIDAFENEYPYITVKIEEIPEKSILDIALAKFGAGDPPDLICFNKVSAENELNASQNFVDLSNQSWVPRLADPKALTASDGHIYGYAVQNMPHCMGIVYNKEIFDKMGLHVPDNYDAFLEVCERLKNEGLIPIYAPFGDLWTFQVWTSSAWGYIAEEIEPDLWMQINSGAKKWSDVPQFLDTLEKGHALYQKGYMQDTLLQDNYYSAIEAFSNEKCAMMIGTSDFVTLMKEKDPSLELGLFPVQAFDSYNPNIAQAQLGALLFIPKNAQHIDEAKLFIDFLAQPDQVNRAQEVMPFIPMINDAEEPLLTDFQQELMTRYIQTDNTVTEMNAYMKVPLDDLWRYYWDMFLGTKSPEQVLKEWDVTFTELMHERGFSGF